MAEPLKVQADWEWTPEYVGGEDHPHTHQKMNTCTPGENLGVEHGAVDIGPYFYKYIGQSYYVFLWSILRWGQFLWE